MSGDSNGSGRTWRGQTSEERQVDRRERLFEAGIELFGTQGYAATSVKSICTEAGLTERYFYEAFNDREDLLAEIYEQLVKDCAKATVEALDGAEQSIEASMRAGLTAFAKKLTEDPRRARIQEIESVGVSEAIERRRRASIHSFADLIADRVRQLGGSELRQGLNLDVIAIGLVGFVNEQLIDHVLGYIDLPLDDVVEGQVAVFVATAESLLD
ncbi:MAG: TetR/AcrR family transcriptional regulator [Solirubrobacterales bacterium]|nr:TetR/AcrR family transcriptional regulator [Solirubrobacterales bacterium]HMT06006.1 TetR/AcrR family transcriptional regulator [Solirubrobacterales bacterium]